jgi:hypothetical protein
MTKVGRLFEEERLEYGRKKEQETHKQYIEKMIQKDMDIVDIMEILGLGREQIEAIKDEMFAVSK